jgi:hypothetical protein
MNQNIFCSKCHRIPSQCVCNNKALRNHEIAEILTKVLDDCELLKKACNKCNGTGGVCEWHPDKEAHKCCGGAGMPCECIGGEK